ncbi:MAG: ribonuclease J, partial [Deltaproteobacteria bacterium]|nr:ribonuclease J [Deltaproteobacteria bacterium]
MNMMVLESASDALIIDCGVMFPDSRDYGVDLILPDFSYLEKIKHKIRALLLTHGHEDHIGAVPYVLRVVKPKIYGSSFTLALLRTKLEEDHRSISVSLNEAKPHQKIKLGVFQVEFLQVTHSIVDGMGLAIHTPQGTVIHTADFKLDP